MRKLMLFALVNTVLLCTVKAGADVMYTYYLIDVNGSQDGYVQFSLDVAPPTAGTVQCASIVSSYYPCQVSGMTFHLADPAPAGMIFTQAENKLITGVTFNSGVLGFLNYNSTIGGGYPLDISLASGGNDTQTIARYSYTDEYFHIGIGQPPYTTGFVESGTYSLTPAAATTPEPSALALLGTGLLAGVGLLRGRRVRAPGAISLEETPRR